MLREQSERVALQAVREKYPTQRAAAKALGITPSYLHDLLHGRRTFSAAVLAKLGLRRTVVKVGGSK